MMLKFLQQRLFWYMEWEMEDVQVALEKEEALELIWQMFIS